MIKKSVKKVAQPPQGMYGAEATGANPLEWNLRSTITAQLRSAGMYAEMDRLSDGSGSWIAIYKSTNNPEKQVEGKRQQIVISFDDAGQIITGIKLYEETLTLTSSGTSLVF